MRFCILGKYNNNANTKLLISVLGLCTYSTNNEHVMFIYDPFVVLKLFLKKWK